RVRVPFMGKREYVRDDLNGGVGSAIYRVKEAFVPKFSSWIRLREIEQQGDDVASWWLWNVFKVLVSCYGDVMEVKENQEKDKIESKLDKNRKRGETGKSFKQLQWIEREKLNKTQKEWPETQAQSKAIQVLKKRRKEGLKLQFS
nr:hypothetical protein [Tanacetum cinerariifolium]